MQERRPGRRWPLVAALVSVLALAAATALLSRDAGARIDAPVTGRADPSAHAHSMAQTRGVPNGDVLPSGARHGHAQPSLIDSLRAARILSDAGLLPLPPQPPLAEILQAVAALAKAGALPPGAGQPSMSEVLRAVRVLAAAGALPPLPRAPVAGPPPQAPPVAPPPPPVPPAPAAAVPPPGASGWYDDAFSQRIRDLVNQQRAQGGLPPVATEPRLAAAASAYAKVLSDSHWFAHVGPDGSTFISRIEAAGFPFTVQLGEILAWGTQNWPPEAIVQAWMNSPTHREEIMSPVYTRAGARCYFTAANATTVYCVIDFAG